MASRSSLTPILKRARQKARRTLKIEQVWVELRWPLLIVFLWGLASLFRIPQSLPDFLHGFIELAAFLFCCFYLFRKYRSRPSPPTTEQLDRLIERSTFQQGHPLSSLNDSPATPSRTLTPQTHVYIWQEYQKRLADSLTSLRVRKPYFFHNWYERFAFLALIGLYAVGLNVTGPHCLSRLKAGFIPGIDDDLAPIASVQAWIEPPSYTRNPVLFLQNQIHQIDAPILEGSHFFAVISGGKGAPYLSGVTQKKYQKLENKNWKIEGLIRDHKVIKLSARGRLIASWDVKIEKDVPPFIDWKEKPKSLKSNWQTTISWKAHQPQGLKSLELVMTQPDQHPLPGHKPRVSHIPLPLDGHPVSVKGEISLDLSADPFAGEKVVAYLQATSLSGLTSKSPTQQISLAARPFHDPLARAFIDLRKRLSLNEETQEQSFVELTLLSHLPMTRDVGAAFSQALNDARKPVHSEQLSEILWFLALYQEDRANSGTAVALSMAEFRAAQQDVLHKINQMAGRSYFPTTEQEVLHEQLERLKNALDKRMNLMFTQASQTGIVLPLPSDKNTPWQKLTHKIQQEALHNETSKARNHLAELSGMAEQMRQAQVPDLQSLSSQMKAQQEAREQRSALRILIQDETKLLDRTHHRLAIYGRHLDSDSQSHDITQMSTASLLRQLGVAAPDYLGYDTPETTPDIHVTRQLSAQRQEDHQTQQGLRSLTELLIKREKDLTGKDNKSFKLAADDMVVALKVIAQRDDKQTALTEQKILEDLSQAQKKMRENQRSMQQKAKGRLGFIPPPQSSQDHPSTQQDNSSSEQDENDNDDDTDNGDDQSSPSKHQDPLGRSLDNDNESDAHIPDNYKNKDYRSIERELQRRASDRTRPKAELDYLNRLLKPLSHPDL